MSIPVFDPTEHYVAVRDAHMADKIVRCTCGWESAGYRWHPRAVMAGERHIKEQQA